MIRCLQNFQVLHSHVLSENLSNDVKPNINIYFLFDAVLNHESRWNIFTLYEHQLNHGLDHVPLDFVLFFFFNYDFKVLAALFEFCYDLPDNVFCDPMCLGHRLGVLFLY